jgi:ribose-phosphate pyrophosphokinase
MMSIDVHSPQTTEHFRRGPYDHLTAQPELRAAVRKHLGEAAVNSVVVAPDAGAVKNNNRHAEELSKSIEADINVIFMGKERARDDSTILKRDKVIQGVEGKVCLTFDDMIDGGGTMISAADTLKNSGAREVYVAATHPIFSGNAAEKLLDSAIDRVFVTDTLPVEDAKGKMGERLEIVRIGPLIGRAIYENMTGGSISKLFDDQNAI